jgi:hypothetical protein
MASERARYRTWIRTGRLVLFAALGAVCLDGVPLHELLPLPFPLRQKKVLGNAMLQAGTK